MSLPKILAMEQIVQQVAVLGFMIGFAVLTFGVLRQKQNVSSYLRDYSKLYVNSWYFLLKK